VGAVGFGGRRQFGSSGVVTGAGGLGVTPGGGIGRRLLLALGRSLAQFGPQRRGISAGRSTTVIAPTTGFNRGGRRRRGFGRGGFGGLGR
jgi:hypothetical protein